jgi:hypothetical protein
VEKSREAFANVLAVDCWDGFVAIKLQLDRVQETEGPSSLAFKLVDTP